MCEVLLTERLPVECAEIARNPIIWGLCYRQSPITAGSNHYKNLLPGIASQLLVEFVMLYSTK